ncbi:MULTISPECIES: hypothetical protein [Phenylobacterium]|uniref:Small-conductance mechanosensitive channel n=1 Tax=Phenylobacterium koreense TaxID=266125 RepID=A0ABV2EET8_9CAUL
MRDLLLGCLRAHAEVLSEPAPGVYLTGAPEGALELTAVSAVAWARHAFKIKSELPVVRPRRGHRPVAPAPASR